MSTITLRLETEIWKDGELVSKKSYPVNSFVKQMADACEHLWSVTARTSIDTGLTTRTLSAGGNQFFLHTQATAGQSDRGIQLGTGTTAPDRDDRAVETQIVDGAGAGQLTYNAVVINPVDTISTGHAISIERQFDNDSGGSITAREITLLAQLTHTGGDAFFLLLRDVLNEVIADAASFIARYIWEFLV